MITLLKLGGSLITDKACPHTPRTDIITQLAEEIARYRQDHTEGLIIGHGSGSFAHVPAKKYGTRSGVRTPAEWAGFAEVHAEAMDLNHIVTDILRSKGLPCLSFVPMNELRSGKEDFGRIRFALEQGLIPVIFGDTVFDDTLGGTIYSTEDLFTRISQTLPGEKRILLAGLEPCIWADFPEKTRPVESLDVNDEAAFQGIGASAFTDVTGGMQEKVRLTAELIRSGAVREAVIFSGIQEGVLQRVLAGELIGTRIFDKTAV